MFKTEIFVYKSFPLFCYFVTKSGNHFLYLLCHPLLYFPPVNKVKKIEKRSFVASLHRLFSIMLFC